ncbi:MAG: hypothetical protein C0411_02185 [Pseudomonas sp.]|nr:hypothetical protein [Pseudomonas sp.]
MSKKYLRDPNLNSVADLVTDEEVRQVFEYTNFGHNDFRGLLSQGCIKALAGWHQGHTLTTILDMLGLINWNKQKQSIKVTDKGRHYIWLAFKGRPGV